MLKKKKYAFWDIIALPMRAAPVFASAKALISLSTGVLPTIQILVFANFIDTAIAIAGGTRAINDIYAPILLVAALIGYRWLIDIGARFAQFWLELRLRKKLRADIVLKCAALRYRYIEDPDSWDVIARVSKEPEVRTRNAYVQLCGFIDMLMQIGGLLIVITSYVWWAGIAIIALSVPLFVIAAKGGQAQYDAWQSVAKYFRRQEYYKEVASGREAVSERSLFGYGDVISKRWHEQYEIARKVQLKTQLKWFIRSKGAGLCIAFVSMGITLILLQPVLSGAITVGLFISIVGTAINMIQMLSWQIPWLLQQIFEGIGFMGDITKFMEMETEDGATDIPAPPTQFKTLELRNVHFKYPTGSGDAPYILKGVNMTIENGKHYSFVGANGMGKTTITKLLCGLYTEYEGEILLNGKELRKYSKAELKSIFSVVYQDFAKYYIKFSDNIKVGNARNMAGTDITYAVEQMDLRETIDKLPHGADNYLGKIKEGGVDLSGGEWQHVALARSMVSPAPIRILDEPTAALDPVAESTLYSRFEEISKGLTTIFVSHRLGSTMLADIIYVIHDGVIAESGSHNDLMMQDGIYAEMFHSQRSWYEKGGDA